MPTAVVTGASRGVGRGVATALAAAGFAVFATGRTIHSADLPAEIIQGRYDMICPPESAFALAQAWPRARLTIVADAGHSALEPGIRSALLRAVERIRPLAAEIALG